MLITYKIMSEESILDWISREISKDTYSDVPQLTNPEHSHLIRKPDMLAIANNDAKTLYNIAHDRFTKSKKKRIIKKILSKFF